MNKHLAVSAILLLYFVILAFLVSPKYDGTINAKDTDAFLKVNKLHYLPLDKLMVLFAD